MWKRDCYTPPDDHIGCHEEEQHDTPVEICVCDENLCNANIEDITSTTRTTTSPTTTSTGGMQHPKSCSILKKCIIKNLKLCVHKIKQAFPIQALDQNAIFVGMMEMSAMQLIMATHSNVKWMMPKKSIMGMCVMLLIQV